MEQFMSGIDVSLKEFQVALGKTPAVCGPHRNLTQRGVGMAAIKNLFQGRGEYLFGIGRAFNESLDRLEKIPLKFTAEGKLSHTQSVDFYQYLNTAKVVEGTLKTSKSKKVQRELKRLKAKVMALRFRMEIDTKQVNGFKELTKLTELADQWKKSQHILNSNYICHLAKTLSHLSPTPSQEKT